MFRRGIVIGAVVVTMLLLAAPALAHTDLTSSTPAAGATVKGPVELVELTFSRDVDLAGEGVEILDGAGATVAVELDVRGAAVRVRPDAPLWKGQYGVRWAVKSDDAHPIRDTFVFTVTGEDQAADNSVASSDHVSSDAAAASGDDAQADSHALADAEAGSSDAAGDLAADGSVAGETRALKQALAADPVAGIRRVDQAARALFYVVALGGLGIYAFLLFAWEGPRREARLLTRLGWRLAALTVVVVLMQTVLRTAQTIGGWSGVVEALPSVVEGPYLIGSVLRLVGAVLLAVGLHGLRRVLQRSATPIAGGSVDVDWRTVTLATHTPPSAGQRIAGAPAAAIGAVGLIASFAFVGHAVTAEPHTVARAAVVAHVTAGAVWGGGLLALVVVLRSRRSTAMAEPAGIVAARFSVLATVALGVVAVAGTALAAVRLDSLSALWRSSYGLALIAKMTVVAVIGGLGAYNHFVIVPALRSGDAREMVHRLRRVGLAEVALLVIVAGLTSVLVGLAS